MPPETVAGPARAWVRAGLAVLALPNTAVGAWLLFAPHSFYTDFPGLGRHWVSALPPYNEHLLTDFGGALLGIAVLVWIAAATMERRIVQVALVTVLVQGTIHFAYHLTRLDALSTGDDVANQAVLALAPVLAAVLLVVLRERPARRSGRRLARLPKRGPGSGIAG